MDEITILARSSSEEPDKVHFRKNRGKLVILCDCEAGIRRQLCKHKIAFASGDRTMLYDADQERKLALVHDWIKKTKLSDILTKLNEAIHMEAEAKERVSEAKKKIGNSMNEGTEIEGSVD